MKNLSQSQSQGDPDVVQSSQASVATSGLPAIPKEEPQEVFLRDYQKPAFVIPKIDMEFEIQELNTVVRSRFEVERNEGVGSDQALFLNGENVRLISVCVDGRELDPKEYTCDEKSLIIPNMPDRAEVKIQTEIDPAKNDSAEGLYISGDTFCTQMEAEGFRKVTFFPDRPDVMSKYTITIIADKTRCPVLLSNGHQINAKDLGDGRYMATWEDPFPKPCYLFGVIAGNLAVIEDSYKTMSGREVALRIYTEAGTEYLCQHAMESIKKTFKYEEEENGLEYDLDLYMLVAVQNFNAGAMENKGLTISNASRVYADPESATDEDFMRVENTVAHEILHNYTGNKVTLRSWHDLTLKEGLTVFREQEFAAAMHSPAIKRIMDVVKLRELQFPEDAGPTAHPIRYESYTEIDNYYTWTVYIKGAEVCRMIQTMIGRDCSKKGLKEYLTRYDGQAVTTEEYVYAHELVSGRDFTQFKNWYSQAGTPKVKVESFYDPDKQIYELHIEQSCDPTPKQDHKEPFHIPIRIGLLDSNGSDLELNLEGSDVDGSTDIVLDVTQPKQIFRFTGVQEEPVPSLLRNFSAPVKLEYDYSNEDLCFLLANDSDPFNRWEAGRRIASNTIHSLMTQAANDQAYSVDSYVIAAFGAVLNDASLDPAFRAEALSLPALDALVEDMEVIDYEAADAARKFLATEIAKNFKTDFTNLYQKLQDELGSEYIYDKESVGMRKLKNTCLAYLCQLDQQTAINLSYNAFADATNMTDREAALAILNGFDCEEREAALAAFYVFWKDRPVVMNKWFQLQASANIIGVLDKVKELELDPCFNAKNPNNQRALFQAFSNNCLVFHASDGSGYEYMADKILEIDKYNSLAAARLAPCYERYAKIDPARRSLMKKALERIMATEGVSSGVKEVVSNTLNSIK